MDGDPGPADLVAVHDEPCRGKLERYSSLRHAIRPSLAEAPTPLESLGIRRLLHQVCARAKTGSAAPALAAAAYGLAPLVGAAGGASDPLRPLGFLARGGDTASAPSISDAPPVRSPEALDAALSEAEPSRAAFDRALDRAGLLST